MIRGLFLIFFLFCFLLSWSQDIAPENQGTYNKLKIEFVNNSQSLTVKDATITADSIHFRKYLSHTTKDMSLNEIRRIRNYRGNYMDIGLIKGLGYGIGYSIGEAIIIALRQDVIFRNDALKRYLILTGATTLVGTLIGAGSSKWETLYENSSPVSRNFHIQPTWYTDEFSAGLSLRVLFR